MHIYKKFAINLYINGIIYFIIIIIIFNFHYIIAYIYIYDNYKNMYLYSIENADGKLIFYITIELFHFFTRS